MFYLISRETPLTTHSQYDIIMTSLRHQPKEQSNADLQHPRNRRNHPGRQRRINSRWTQASDALHPFAKHKLLRNHHQNHLNGIKWKPDRIAES